MKFFLRFLICVFVLAIPSVAFSQVVVNPLLVQFDSVDHANAGIYKVEFWLQGVDPTIGQPIQVSDLSLTAIRDRGVGVTPRYEANLSALTPLFSIPLGQMYVARMRTVLALDPTLISVLSVASNPFVAAVAPATPTNVTFSK